LFVQSVSSTAFNVLDINDGFLAPVQFAQAGFNVIARSVTPTIMVAKQLKCIGKYFRFGTIPTARNGMFDEALKFQRYCDCHCFTSAESRYAGKEVTKTGRKPRHDLPEALFRVLSRRPCTVSTSQSRIIDMTATYNQAGSTRITPASAVDPAATVLTSGSQKPGAET
jgi:hypothetical protein